MLLDRAAVVLSRRPLSRLGPFSYSFVYFLLIDRLYPFLSQHGHHVSTTCNQTSWSLSLVTIRHPQDPTSADEHILPLLLRVLRGMGYQRPTVPLLGGLFRDNFALTSPTVLPWPTRPIEDEY
jgi:hypothetical protein